MHSKVIGTGTDTSDLPPARTAVPALDVGGTHVTAALVDAHSLVVVPGSKKRHELDSSAAADVILAVLAAAILDAAAAASVRGLGVCTAGGVAMPDPFDYEHGIALFTGVGKFERLYGTNVRTELLKRLAGRGAPGREVPGREVPSHEVPSHEVPGRIEFLNDADAFVLGEWVSGAARGTGRCVAITLGTGIGSGWLADGHAVSDGDAVPPGGRAHRLTVDGIPLEDVVSRRAIRRAYAEATEPAGFTGPTADVREICDRARAGEAAAAGVLDVAFTGLGRALGPLFTRFAPEVVVVGGSMAASWELFEPSVLRGMGAVDPLRFAVTAGAEDAALVGAARHALDQIAQR